jgi:hypothetical protein
VSPSLIGKLFGALLWAFLLTRVVDHYFYKTHPPVSKALLVALTALGVSVGIATAGMGFAEGVTTYTPAILAWLVFDLVQARRRGASALRSGVPERNERPESTQDGARNAVVSGDRLPEGVGRHRDRLVVFLSLVVAVGIAAAIWDRPNAADLVALLFLAELILVVSVAANAYRRKHHLTWQQILGQVVPVVVTMGVFLGLLLAIAAIQANWETFRPILLLVGFFVAALGIVLLVLYLAVRVVRAAWKH